MRHLPSENVTCRGEVEDCKMNVVGVLSKCAVLILCFSASNSQAAAVWRVTGPGGQTLYLAGSVHGLKSSDYPLPPAYNRAFDASSHLVLEDSPDVPRGAAEKLYKSGLYPKGDSLKNHIDPRTYDYLVRLFALWGVPEKKLAQCRPWTLIMMLWSSSTNSLGVEGFLIRRARANGKPISGLETFREHAEVISGLSDRQAELALLETFIPQAPGAPSNERVLRAWRRGDVEVLARFEADSFRDIPSVRERLIEARNRNWVPKIEGYLRSRQTYFVVAGAAHMGGPDGVLALLRARGYQIEQL
jgi:uncharacterized protein